MDLVRPASWVVALSTASIYWSHSPTQVALPVGLALAARCPVRGGQGQRPPHAAGVPFGAALAGSNDAALTRADGGHGHGSWRPPG